MRKNMLGWLLRIIITVGLFILLFKYFVDPTQIVVELANLSVIWLLAALVVKLAGIYASILRWQVLLRAQGLLISHWHLVSTFLIGRFIGTFLPSTIGLDAYRAYDIARWSSATTKSVAVIAVEKVIGFFALSSLVLITLPAGLHFLPNQVLVFVFLVFCVPVTLSFILLLEPGLAMRLLDLPLPFKRRVTGKLEQAAEAITIYRSQKRVLFLAVLFGLGVHLGTTLMYYCTAQAIGAPITLHNILFVGPLMIVATVGLPSIGGEGVRELTLVGLLARIGISESSAFVVGHLGFWVGLTLSLVGGVIYMIRPTSYQPKVRMLSQSPSPPISETSPVGSSQL